jgi:hypothetical protein
MLLVLFLIYVFYRKKGSVKVQKIPHRHLLPAWGYILVLCIINGLFFCFFAGRIIDFEEGMFRPYSFDLDYYAKLSQYLNLGYENGLLEYNFFKSIAPIPYHYFELWTNAIFYKIYGLNAVVFYMTSMPMIFCTLIFTALIAILEIRKKITPLYILLAFIGLLFADVIPYISEIFPLIIKGGVTQLSYPKFLPVYLFLFASVVLYMYRQKQEAYYVLLSIPLLNIIPIFAVWGSVGVFLLIDVYKKRAVNWKYWVPFLSVVLLYFIYVLQSSSRASSYRESFHWGLLRLYITQPIVYLLLYVHFIVALFLLNRKYIQAFIRKKVFLFAVVCFSALTASIVMRSYSGDASQFAMCSLPILMYVFVVVSFLLIVTGTKFTRAKKCFLFGLCGISLLISFDAYKRDLIPWHHVYYDYEAKILSRLPSDKKEYRIGFYIDECGAFGNGGNYVSGVVDGVTIPDMLDYYYNNVYHYSVNKGNKEVQYADEHTPFRDYHAKIKAESPDITDDEIRISFIRENQIEYIRVFKTVSLSDEFLSHLSLLAEDTASGQRFYKVDVVE